MTKILDSDFEYIYIYIYMKIVMRLKTKTLGIIDALAMLQYWNSH